MSSSRKAPRLRWLTAISVVGVLAVNAAGLWGIAVARRGAAEHASRVFHLEVAARARSIESAVSSTRADLAFLAGSAAFLTLERALRGGDPREARWRRLGAEGTLLLFLRGHPEVRHLSLWSSDESRLVQAGRRGGVPVVWRSDETPSIAQDGIAASFPFAADPGAASAQGRMGRLEADLDPALLLARARGPGGRARSCTLEDSAGRLLGGETAGPVSRDGRVERSETSERAEATERAGAVIRAEGWSAASPWTLTCEQDPEAMVGLIDPIARSYRLTMALNVAVMALALLLGSFAIQQTRRRELLEARAREEARVREIERQLFHAERLSTVGRLAAGMAHEINNPLEGMSNYLALANDSLARGDTAAARGHLDRVAEGLHRAAGVVRGVLQHAEPAGAARSPLDLNATLLQSVEFVRSRREFAHVRFELDLARPDPVMLGDQGLLGQLFLNLLLNACEAQPGGGEVRLTTRSGGRDISVEIADRGPGVPGSDAARIFEPFYSTKESTGLGLSICQAIVRQHAGEIGVEPRPGGGALFKLSFPRADPPG